MLSTTSPQCSIAITGMGAVTPYGTSVATFWQALLAGQSAISEMDLFELGGITCTRAGVIRNFPQPGAAAPTPRASGFAFTACQEALSQAQLTDDPQKRTTTALITASNFGDIDAGEEALYAASPTNAAWAASQHCAHATPAINLAHRLQLGGPILPLSLSCASGAGAIATAATLIAANQIERAVIVGYDALSRFAWSGLCALRTMTKECVRPFDPTRSGTIFSEGAAAIVLERADLAARPLAWISGWASGNNGHHMTAPAPRAAGSLQVMRAAVQKAGVMASAIDHFNAHGTATKPNDTTEAQALHDLLGAHAATIPTTSIKGYLGHMLGAAGTIEVIAAVLTLQKGIIPPTGNHTTLDPTCDLNVVTKPQVQAVQTILSNSAGFGGCNAALVITQPQPTPPATPTLPQPVAITGMGVLSALGLNHEETAAALAEGESALFPASLPWYHTSDTPAPEVGEVPEFDLKECGVAPKAYLDRASKLLLGACGLAIADAQLDKAHLATQNMGIMCGTTWGCLSTAETFFADFVDKGPRLVKPFLFPHAYPNTAISLSAMEWGLTGAHENHVAAYTAASLSLVQAFMTLQAGQATQLIAGGVDVLSKTRWLATPAQEVAAGEAAAMLILTTASCAPAMVKGYLLAAGVAASAQEVLKEVWRQSTLEAADLAAIYVNQAARATLKRLLPDASLITTEELCGEVAGATGALHLGLGLLAQPQKTFMVVTGTPQTWVALIARAV